MCRNIKPLFNFDPPVNAEEIRAASLQFVKKISGFNKPSKANEASFLAAVDEIAAISTRLLHSLETNAPPKNREEEAAKAKARSAARFGGGRESGCKIGYTMADNIKVQIRQIAFSISEAAIRDHRVLIDRPVAKGGADQGP